MTWCILLCATTVLLGQAADPRDQRIRLALSSPDPTAAQLESVHSDRITAALRSPDALWAFITSPEQMYLERRAAAFQSKGLVPVTWLPKIWRTMGELWREQRLHEFGLKPHPVSSMMWMPRPPAFPAERSILGHPWKVPAEPIEFPLTPKEREDAPWPWQVEQALIDLRAGLYPSTYAPLNRDAADAYLAAVLTMPCGTDEEAQWLIGAVQGSSHYKTPAVMAALRNIATNPGFPLAAVQVGSEYADATRLWNDPRSWDIGVAGLLDMLRRAPTAQARQNAAYSVRSLRESFVDGRTLRRPLPAAVMLEMSRLALDPSAGDAWTRLYAYAFSAIEAMDAPPFAADRRMDPASPEVARRLRDFASWLEGHRRELETLAAAQKPSLDAAERLLAGTTACAAK